MSQDYVATNPVTGTTVFGGLYAIIRNHFLACVSSFSGTSFPASPVAGQLCYRTDLGDQGKLYKYDNSGTWVDIDILDYQEIYINAGAMISKATAGALSGTNEYVTNDWNLDYFSFIKASESYVDFSFRFPSFWNLGTVKAKFYWSPGSSACAVGDTVEWEIGGVAISDDDPIDASIGGTQVISDTVLVGKDGDMHITDVTPAITIGGSPAAEDFVNFRISRNIGGTDDMAEDAWLFGVAIQFGVNNAITAW